MEEFTKERNIEKRALVIIDYFKLVKLGNFTENENPIVFEMLGGKELVNKLAIASIEGLFDVSKSNRELLAELENSINVVNSIMWTQSKATSEIINYGNLVINDSKEIDKDELVFRTFYKSLSYTFVSDNSALVSKVINGKSKDDIKNKVKVINNPTYTVLKD